MLEMAWTILQYMKCKLIINYIVYSSYGYYSLYKCHISPQINIFICLHYLAMPNGLQMAMYNVSDVTHNFTNTSLNIDVYF